MVSISAATAMLEDTVTQKAVLMNGPVSTYRVSGFVGKPGLDSAHRLGNFLNRVVPSDMRVSQIIIPEIAIRSEQRSSLDSEVIAFQGEYVAAHEIPLIAGAWPTDDKYLAHRVVLNQRAADELSASIGDPIFLDSPEIRTPGRVIVTGIVGDAANVSRAYMDLSAYEAFYGYFPNNSSLVVEISSASVTTEWIQRKISSQILFPYHNGELRVNKTDVVDDYLAQVSASQTIVLGAGAIGILAGSIGVANIGLSALRERSVELSLRRALGASRLDVSVIMVFEAQLLAIIAGFIALPLCFLLYPYLGILFGAPLGLELPPFPVEYAIAGFFLGMSAAFAGAFVPALRAFSVPIAGVMRE